jgi:magnesium transporter
MLKAFVYEAASKQTRVANREEIVSLQQQPGNFLWLDVQDPTSEDFQKLADDFSLNEIAIHNAQSHRHHPKLDLYEDHFFSVIHGVHDNSTPERYEPVCVSFFLGRNFLISIHPVLNEFAEFQKQCEKGKPILCEGPARLLHLMFDKIVDEFMPFMEQVSHRVQKLEDQVLKTQTTEIFEEAFLLKRTLVYLRQTVVHQKDVLLRLTQQDLEFTEEDDRIFFLDIANNITRVLDQVDSLRDIVTNLVETNVALATQRLNEVMKVLTIISTIFLPLTFIVGIYGMNFDYDVSVLNMPELHAPLGYPLVMLAMTTIALGMVIFFKRKRWF